jgi:hypothetical protein
MTRLLWQLLQHTKLYVGGGGVLRAENRTISAPLHLNLNRVLSVMLLHEFAATAHTPPLIALLHAEC